MLGEGGIVVGSNGFSKSGIDAGEHGKHGRDGFGGGFSDQPGGQRQARLSFMQNKYGPCSLQMMRSPSQ